MNTSVAFFGLGAMGSPIAKTMLRAGITVRTSLHPSQDMERIKPLSEFPNFQVYPTNEAAAEGQDFIFTILPADPQVKEFLINDRFAASVKGGASIIDMSSLTSGAIQEVEAYYKPRGIYVLDCPVTGGIAAAETGSMVIFGSGDKGAFSKASPLFDVIGSTVYELGPCGMGKTFKNINNMLLCCNLMCVCEAYHIAKSQNLDIKRLYEVISTGSGNSVALRRMLRMMEDNWKSGFEVALARKDLENALKIAPDVPAPMAKLARELMAANRKYDRNDLTAMFKLFEGE